MLVSTLVVWSLLKGLPAARRSTRLLHLLVATVGTLVLPGVILYLLHQYEPRGTWGEWNTPLPPLEFVVSVLVLSGFIIFQVLLLLRDVFSARAPHGRRRPR
jgi:hypothetical protein